MLLRKLLIPLFILALPTTALAAFTATWQATSTPSTFVSPSLINGNNQALLLSTTATSTFAGGVNITGGCVALKGNCVSSSAAGLNTQVQYNKAGAFAGDAGLTYNDTSKQLTVTKSGLSAFFGVDGPQVGVYGSSGDQIATTNGTLDYDYANGNLTVDSTGLFTVNSGNMAFPGGTPNLISFGDDPSEFIQAAFGIGLHGDIDHPVYVAGAPLILGDNSFGSLGGSNIGQFIQYSSDGGYRIIDSDPQGDTTIQPNGAFNVDTTISGNAGGISLNSADVTNITSGAAIYINDNSGTFFTSLEPVVVGSNGQFPYIGVNPLFEVSGSSYTTSNMIGALVGVATTTQTSFSPNDTNFLIDVNASTGAKTISLGLIGTSAVPGGKMYMVKKTDSSSNYVTIAISGAQQIDNSSTYVLRNQNEFVIIAANAAQNAWNVISAGTSNPLENVVNTDGSISVANTPGTSTVSLDVSHANTWTGKQTFNTTAPQVGTATVTTPAAFDASKNLISGSYSGNTTKVATVSGTLTSGNFTKTDASGNVVDGGGAIFAPATADLTAQSAAVASVLAVTSPNDGSAHQYRVGAYINVTALVLDVAQVQCTYTDENSNSVTANFFPQGLTSANIASTGSFSLPPQDIRVKANTAIRIKTILTTSTGSITYDVGGNITRLN